jgi:hypothetical protein
MNKIDDPVYCVRSPDRSRTWCGKDTDCVDFIASVGYLFENIMAHGSGKLLCSPCALEILNAIRRVMCSPQFPREKTMDERREPESVSSSVVDLYSTAMSALTKSTALLRTYQNKVDSLFDRTEKLERDQAKTDDLSGRVGDLHSSLSVLNETVNKIGMSVNKFGFSKTVAITQEPIQIRQEILRIRYRNHRAEDTWRRVIPIRVECCETEWHPKKQYVLNAFDLDRNAELTFALIDILEFGETEL